MASEFTSDDSRCEIDDDRATPRDPLDVGVDDRLAVGIERAGGFVENEDARVQISARAMASRCRWPPDKFGDPS